MTSLPLGGCVLERQIGAADGTGGAPSTTATGGDTTNTSTATTGGGTMNTSTVTTGGGDPGASAIALLNAQITQLTAEQKKVWLTPGEALDPTTLILLLNVEPETCSAPIIAPTYSQKSLHQVLIGLPAAMQKVGTYDIASTDVIGYSFDWLTDGMGNGGGGGGSLDKGTVEVLSVDATILRVRLTLVSDPPAPPKDYIVTRCQ